MAGSSMSDEQLTLRSDSPSVLRLFLLGGFRVERARHIIPDSAWKRRSAKTLVKILAIVPRHQLHREQATEVLWPGAPGKSAADSLHKALRAARQALEPELAPGEASCCLLM